MTAAPVVAVTGLGVLTGVGLDRDSSWHGVVEGQSPIGPFRTFDPTGLQCPYGVELPGGAEDLFKARIKKRRRTQMTRATKMAVVTAQMALEESGVVPGDTTPPHRLGVVAGTTGTGYVPPTDAPDQHRILRNMASAPAAWISIITGAQGPAFVVSTACASGAYALASAHGLITSGQCDVVIAGSAESSLNFPDAEGFASLMALPGLECHETASRPFDRNRDGFVMGEGAGYLIVESLESAHRRGARVWAHLWPPALTSDSYNILSPAPEGRGMVTAMSRALEYSGLSPDEIDYVNAHGTSTQLNDLYETRAIEAVFGERAPQLPISSTKGVTGHCLSGAAGVEAVLCCEALSRGFIPPTANLTDPDPELTLDYVPLRGREAELKHVMSNSFAFGGHNGVCLFSRP